MCSGRTGHTEAVLVLFKPSEVSFTALCEKLMSTIDPTLLNQVGQARARALALALALALARALALALALVLALALALALTLRLTLTQPLPLSRLHAEGALSCMRDMGEEMEV